MGSPRFPVTIAPEKLSESRPPEHGPAAFVRELERVDPADPIAAAWRWRLGGGDINNPPYRWPEAQVAYNAWHRKAVAGVGAVRGHLEELRRRAPEPRSPAAIDETSATAEWRAGVVALLDDFIFAVAVTPGKRARWQETVRRLRELLDDIRGA